MNANNTLGQKTPFTEHQVEIVDELLAADKSILAMRDRALMRVAIDTMLRGNDVLKLTVGDVSFNGEIKDEFYLKMKKTKLTVKCQLLPKAQRALRLWIVVGGIELPKERIFKIGLRQYSRIVKSFAVMLKLDPSRYSTHSLRKTKPTIIYAKTKNIEAVKQLLGHSGLQATSAYLGIGRTEALAIAREFDI